MLKLPANRCVSPVIHSSPRPRRAALARLVLFVTAVTLALAPAGFAAGEPTVIEGEAHLGKGAEAYRDKAASNGEVAARLIANGGPIMQAGPVLPPGDYRVRFMMRAKPVETLHGLEINLQAGNVRRHLQAAHFDAAEVWQPFDMQVVHPGGPMQLSASGEGESGFDGQRLAGGSEDSVETGAPPKPAVANIDADPLAGGLDDGGGLGGGLGDDFRLEEAALLSSLKGEDWWAAVDSIIITPLRQPAAVVTDVVIDKIHYKPGEQGQATITIRSADKPLRLELVTELVTELDTVYPVASQTIKVASSAESITIPFTTPDHDVFGVAFRATLRDGDQFVHANEEYFGSTQNVYRMGITGSAITHHRAGTPPERIDRIMRENKAKYANHYEVFAWGECDYSELTPETEEFWSGQTQYHGTISVFKDMLATGHRYGIKGITYGKASAASIAGFETFRKHPGLFRRNRRWGPATEAFDTFFLERMVHGEYNFKDRKELPGIAQGWQHWASIWVDMETHESADFGADELIASAKMFGWDGVRWDGHFIGHTARTEKRLNDALPDYVHGYNIAFVNPGSELFLPPADSVQDFHEAAANHGLMMDESARNWSNTQFSWGAIRPFYESICREADYIKRVGGLPLFITFDMRSPQDLTYNVLSGLAAGQRYTYITSPGDFDYGPLPRWLTRYAAFVWDDTLLVKEPARFINVDAPLAYDSPKDKRVGDEVWWQWSTWIRKLPNGRQQLLVNILNPPSYPQYCNRYQAPPRTRENISVSVKTPEGAKLVRSFHLSPDLEQGHEMLKAASTGDGSSVKLDRLRHWSIVAFEFESTNGSALEEPIFELTTPVEDAAAVFADQERARKEADQKKQAQEASIAAPDIDKAEPEEPQLNPEEKRLVKLTEDQGRQIRRDPELDVHHARGVYSWLNPVQQAVGLLGGGETSVSYVHRVGFRLRGNGCMGDFPDRDEDLLQQDVMVIDNVHAIDLGQQRRPAIVDFVKNRGGGAVIFGGYFVLTNGKEEKTTLGQITPIQQQPEFTMAIEPAGMPLKPGPGASKLGQIDWSNAGVAYCVDTSPLKEGVEVLAYAGGHPAIVAQQVGKGRVVTVLINSHHEPVGDAPNAYWKTDVWPHLVAGVIDYAAGDYQAPEPPPVVRSINPKHVHPDLLMLESMGMSGAEFSKQLASAVNNVVDADTAETLMRVLLDNTDKVGDVELLERVTRVCAPYLDASLAPMGEELLLSSHPFMRHAGLRILGRTGDKKYRPQLVNALGDKVPTNAREALVGLANLKDTAAIPAVRDIARKPEMRMLALSVLLRLGDDKTAADAAKWYPQGRRRALAMKCGRMAKHEDLYGGTSFKLTPAQRRMHMVQYKDLKEWEAQTRFDLQYFHDTLAQISTDDANAMIAVIADSDWYHHELLAYELLGRVEESQKPALIAAVQK